MTRCPSIYQNRDQFGLPLGAPKRCSRDLDHPLTISTVGALAEMHVWGATGRRTRWPEAASEQSIATAALKRVSEAAYAYVGEYGYDDGADVETDLAALTRVILEFVR